MKTYQVKEHLPQATAHSMKPTNLKTRDDRKSAFLSIIALLIQNIIVTVAMHPGNETDHTALLAIKIQLVDQPHGVLSSWNNSFHHCSWEGVICGRKHNRVTQLDLSSRGLAGTISPFIGNMTYLRNISIYNNSLSGKIPETLGLLYRLNGLWLFNNTLTGEIPASISSCIYLRSISLGFNKLEGQLPVGVGTLSRLELLSVSHNKLRGTLFNIIQNLTSLVEISAIYNLFTGTIPKSIGRIRNLTSLKVSENELTGTLPTSLSNLSSLQYLQVGYNHLHGEVPANIGLTLSRLKKLHLEGNNFSGSIPITIGNLTSLMNLQLSHNGFTGRVPQGLGNFPNLNILLLSFNYLMGDISFISTLVNCSNLIVIEMRVNYFTGILPTAVANLSITLTWLSLGDSFITGTLPAGITNLINLQHLAMSGSELTPSIPHDIGKLQKMDYLDLSSNRLTGRIPNSVGNLSRLSAVYLYNNKLDGSIPESVGDLQSLIYLFLFNNNFSGKLSSKLFDGKAQFVQIYLSQNRLEGSLPFEISKQINLNDFRVSNNMLSGVIPDSLSDCIMLQYLNMQGNNFHGSIPPSFTSLSSLVDLDLSQNHLTGQIPAYLSNFPLTYLNLSYNDFEGRIPTKGVFANVSDVFLVGNNRLCGGTQALHLRKCVEKKITKRKKLSSPLKMVIYTVSALVGVLAMSIGFFLIYKKIKRQPILQTLTTTETFPQVSYDMLLKATSGFSSDNLLGVGSFGSVFKGILSGKTIAVKVLNMEHRGASKSFIAECKTLRNVRHRNLAHIITACSSIDFQRNDFRALVYEFMPNGSLDKWLLGVFGNMSLAQRVDVAIDVAHALNYLHLECEIPIVHCDLKPSNILLDNDMVAHVGDFGLSKFLSHPQHPNQSSTIGIRGTIGYAAPEYGLGSEASTKGDVYSYGILLLELMTGKSPTDNMFKEGNNLHMYAKEALPDQVLQIVDPTLDEDNQTEETDHRKATQDMLQRRVECIITVISVGVSCSHHSPQNRMEITDAISRLHAARDNLLNARIGAAIIQQEVYRTFTAKKTLE